MPWVQPVTQLVGDPLRAPTVLAQLLTQGADQTDRPLLFLRAVPACCCLLRWLFRWHGLILVSKVRSLQETQGDSDRGFYSFPLWEQAAATGADLLWRISKSVKPHPIEELSDGSWLVEIRPPNTPGLKGGEPFRVRLIDYTVNNGTGHEAGEFRLFTTVLDPDDITATELAAAYTQRWEIESAFDELKTHQRGPRVVLRSKSPDMVHQEIWGHLCCHYAIRTLMCEAAEHAGHDPDRVSFVAAITITRASIAQPGDFPPSHN